ncbi:MAG: Eco57I restriction-modification methylase domain-containing protein, partial [Thermodesulfobacteriota bacterium]|nr:Eco57I restriction-modification methylase domain-containing protein [Thermodesulfobacteriota bacterium]
NEIADILKKGNLPVESAEQLASWDPYDQNGVSPFFDPEWMFDVKDGFDIVIGNPPYASAVTMARSKKLKLLYKSLYPLATGAYDIYVLFLYKAIHLLNKTGQYTWIIPNKFQIADYATKTKSYLIENGLTFSVDVSTFNVFETANVYPIVIVGDKSQTTPSFTEYLLEKYTDLEKREYAEPLKLKTHNLIKDHNLILASGATGFEAKKIKDIITTESSQNSIPFTVSGCIDRFAITNKNVRYMGLKLDKAFVKNSNVISTSKWQFWNSPKIVIAGMTKEIEAVYVDRPFGLGVGVYAVRFWGDFEPYSLTAILNSSYLTFYLKNKFKDKHLAGGYLAINKSTLENLPLEKPTNEKPYTFLSKILHVFESNSNFPKQIIKIVLDSIVFELYFPDHMKERKIDVLQFVEKDCTESFQLLGVDFQKQDAFDTLSDTQKEQIITELHNRWSDPDSEIVKRMNSFSEKSPEILKPILESSK